MNQRRRNRLYRTPYPFSATTPYGEVLTTRTEVHKYNKHLPTSPDLSFLKNYSKELPEINITHQEDILKDAQRTIVRNSHNKQEMTTKLIQILKSIEASYGNYLPQLLHLAASLLFVSNDESMTYGVLLELIKILDDYFTDNMIGIQADVELIKKLITFQHPSISIINVMSSVVWRWLLGCMASDFPLYTTIETIHLILLKGRCGLVSLCYGLLERTVEFDDPEAIKYYPFTVYRFGKVTEIMSTYQIPNYILFHKQELEKIKINQSFSLHFKIQSSIELLVKGVGNILSISQYESENIVKKCNNFGAKSCESLEKKFYDCQKLYKLFGGTRNEMKHLQLFGIIVWALDGTLELRCKIIFENLNRLQKDSLMFADLETGIKRFNDYLISEKKDSSCIDVHNLRLKYPVQNITIKMLNLMCKNELSILVEGSSLGIEGSKIKDKIIEMYSSI
ncbi:hypothetical protein KM1_050560 [Entamoeba histolytica HM-3:IMSS]|uniref:Rab-GAP TBC domain-containing protein n=1 Tax=Entamoeba histolytica HM-3:IMSS TaxID=885315 RepID=M7WES9_ENTHI|nr:hypothetical protein KM1_050560 [Entamoeba histolytica HM-3:IMSS]